MLIAAGLSPAWQQVLVFDAFQAGAVNRAADTYWCASGKVLNVGIALHHLCGRRPDATLTISTLGGDAYEPIERELSALGVSRRWIRTQSPTRTCTTIVDRATGLATELVQPARPVSDADLAEFEAAFAAAASHADVVVLTGSLPAGAPSDFFRRLLTHVRGRAVLDIRGSELLSTLDAHPFLVKPNRDELGQTMGRLLRRDDDLREAIVELQRRGAESVVVTSGGDAVWLATGGELLQLQPPAVARIVNPIGCGDCMAAGIAWALDQGCDVRDAVARGMDAAAMNLQTLLPSDLDGRRALYCRR